MNVVRSSKRVLALLVAAAGVASLAFAQDTSESAPAPPSGQDVARDGIITSLASQLFEGDFVNFYAFFDGVYDTTQQTLQSANRGGGGFSVGGGVTASKHFSNASLSLSYRGDYRDYAAGSQGSGTDQYLSLVYVKRLSERWTFTFNQTAGILFYSNAFYNTPTSSGGVLTNPFSPTTRFLASSVYMSYQQTARLRYTVGGSFFLNRYNYPGSIGSTGGIGSLSAVYQLTSRTTVGGTYSHDNFVFQRSAGNTGIDGGYGTVTHIFGRDWHASVSAGITSVRTSGTIDVPLGFIIPTNPNAPPVGVFALQHYNTTSLVPTVQGSISHRLQKLIITASAGHGVNPGNGTYLTSSNTYFGGSVSRPFSRKSVLSATTSYSRISSIANKVSQGYSQNFTTINYSRILIPHISAFFAYNFDRYGGLLNYGASTDNRFVAGLSFSSKNVPLTPY